LEINREVKGEADMIIRDSSVSEGAHPTADE
jgi:hypothetical protein